jgi:hypothetical protein
MGHHVQMRRSGFLVLGASFVAALVLGGCTSGSGSATRSANSTSSAVSPSVAPTTTQEATPTIPADVPLTGKNLNAVGETPPVMPVLATKHTAEGAVAFARFFMQTIDWGYATSDPAYMNHYFEESCTQCLNYRTFLTSAKNKNAYYRGSRATLVDQSVGEVGGPFGAELSIIQHLDITAWDLVDLEDRSLGSGISLNNIRQETWAKWSDSAWVVVDITLGDR